MLAQMTPWEETLADYNTYTVDEGEPEIPADVACMVPFEDPFREEPEDRPFSDHADNLLWSLQAALVNREDALHALACMSAREVKSLWTFVSIVGREQGV